MIVLSELVDSKLQRKKYNVLIFFLDSRSDGRSSLYQQLYHEDSPFSWIHWKIPSLSVYGWVCLMVGALIQLVQYSMRVANTGTHTHTHTSGFSTAAGEFLVLV